MSENEKTETSSDSSWIKWLVLLLIALGLLLGGIYLYFFQPNIIPGIAEFGPTYEEPVNMLLIGVDWNYFVEDEEEKKEEVRADLLLWGQINPQDKKITIISIPRHTRVDIDGLEENKVRYSHQEGEIPMTIEAVEEIMGQEVDYYVRIDFDSFRGIIDILDGVDVEFDEPLYDEDLKLEIDRGRQRLDPDTALNYARYIGEDENELARIDRQQKLARAIYDRTLQIETMPRIPRLYQQIMDTVQYIETDIDQNTVVKTINLIKTMDEPYPELYLLPGREFNQYWIINEREKQQLIKIEG